MVFNFDVYGRVLNLRLVSSGSSVSLFYRGEARSVGSTLTSNLEEMSVAFFTLIDIC